MSPYVSIPMRTLGDHSKYVKLLLPIDALYHIKHNHHMTWFWCHTDKDVVSLDGKKSLKSHMCLDNFTHEIVNDIDVWDFRTFNTKGYKIC